MEELVEKKKMGLNADKELLSKESAIVFPKIKPNKPSPMSEITALQNILVKWMMNMKTYRQKLKRKGVEVNRFEIG